MVKKSKKADPKDNQKKMKPNPQKATLPGSDDGSFEIIKKFLGNQANIPIIQYEKELISLIEFYSISKEAVKSKKFSREIVSDGMSEAGKALFDWLRAPVEANGKINYFASCYSKCISATKYIAELSIPYVQSSLSASCQSIIEGLGEITSNPWLKHAISQWVNHLKNNLDPISFESFLNENCNKDNSIDSLMGSEYKKEESKLNQGLDQLYQTMRLINTIDNNIPNQKKGVKLFSAFHTQETLAPLGRIASWNLENIFSPELKPLVANPEGVNFVRSVAVLQQLLQGYPNLQLMFLETAMQAVKEGKVNDYLNPENIDVPYIKTLIKQKEKHNRNVGRLKAEWKAFNKKQEVVELFEQVKNNFLALGEIGEPLMNTLPHAFHTSYTKAYFATRKEVTGTELKLLQYIFGQYSAYYVGEIIKPYWEKNAKEYREKAIVILHKENKPSTDEMAINKIIKDLHLTDCKTGFGQKLEMAILKLDKIKKDKNKNQKEKKEQIDELYNDLPEQLKRNEFNKSIKDYFCGSVSDPLTHEIFSEILDIATCRVNASKPLEAIGDDNLQTLRNSSVHLSHRNDIHEDERQRMMHQAFGGSFDSLFLGTLESWFKQCKNRTRAEYLEPVFSSIMEIKNVVHTYKFKMINDFIDQSDAILASDDTIDEKANRFEEAFNQFSNQYKHVLKHAKEHEQAEAYKTERLFIKKLCLPKSDDNNMGSLEKRVGNLSEINKLDANVLPSENPLKIPKSQNILLAFEKLAIIESWAEANFEMLVGYFPASLERTIELNQLDKLNGYTGYSVDQWQAISYLAILNEVRSFYRDASHILSDETLSYQFRNFKFKERVNLFVQTFDNRSNDIATPTGRNRNQNKGRGSRTPVSLLPQSSSKKSVFNKAQSLFRNRYTQSRDDTINTILLKLKEYYNSKYHSSHFSLDGSKHTSTLQDLNTSLSFHYVIDKLFKDEIASQHINPVHILSFLGRVFEDKASGYERQNKSQTYKSAADYLDLTRTGTAFEVLLNNERGDILKDIGAIIENKNFPLADLANKLSYFEEFTLSNIFKELRKFPFAGLVPLIERYEALIAEAMSYSEIKGNNKALISIINSLTDPKSNTLNGFKKLRDLYNKAQNNITFSIDDILPNLSTHLKKTPVKKEDISRFREILSFSKKSSPIDEAMNGLLPEIKDFLSSDLENLPDDDKKITKLDNALIIFNNPRLLNKAGFSIQVEEACESCINNQFQQFINGLQANDVLLKSPLDTLSNINNVRRILDELYDSYYDQTISDGNYKDTNLILNHASPQLKSFNEILKENQYDVFDKLYMIETLSQKLCDYGVFVLACSKLHNSVRDKVENIKLIHFERTGAIIPANVLGTEIEALGSKKKSDIFKSEINDYVKETGLPKNQTSQIRKNLKRYLTNFITYYQTAEQLESLINTQAEGRVFKPKLIGEEHLGDHNVNAVQQQHLELIHQKNVFSSDKIYELMLGEHINAANNGHRIERYFWYDGLDNESGNGMHFLNNSGVQSDVNGSNFHIAYFPRSSKDPNDIQDKIFERQTHFLSEAYRLDLCQLFENYSDNPVNKEWYYNCIIGLGARFLAADSYKHYTSQGDVSKLVFGDFNKDKQFIEKLNIRSHESLTYLWRFDPSALEKFLRSMAYNQNDPPLAHRVTHTFQGGQYTKISPKKINSIYAYIEHNILYAPLYSAFYYNSLLPSSVLSLHRVNDPKEKASECFNQCMQGRYKSLPSPVSFDSLIYIITQDAIKNRDALLNYIEDGLDKGQGIHAKFSTLEKFRIYEEICKSLVDDEYKVDLSRIFDEQKINTDHVRLIELRLSQLLNNDPLAEVGNPNYNFSQAHQQKKYGLRTAMRLMGLEEQVRADIWHDVVVTPLRKHIEALKQDEQEREQIERQQQQQAEQKLNQCKQALIHACYNNEALNDARKFYKDERALFNKATQDLWVDAGSNVGTLGQMSLGRSDLIPQFSSTYNINKGKQFSRLNANYFGDSADEFKDNYNDLYRELQNNDRRLPTEIAIQSAAYYAFKDRIDTLVRLTDSLLPRRPANLDALPNLDGLSSSLKRLNETTFSKVFMDDGAEHACIVRIFEDPQAILINEATLVAQYFIDSVMTESNDQEVWETRRDAFRLLSSDSNNMEVLFNQIAELLNLENDNPLKRAGHYFVIDIFNAINLTYRDQETQQHQRVILKETIQGILTQAQERCRLRICELDQQKDEELQQEQARQHQKKLEIIKAHILVSNQSMFLNNDVDNEPENVFQAFEQIENELQQRQMDVGALVPLRTKILNPNEKAKIQENLESYKQAITTAFESSILNPFLAVLQQRYPTDINQPLTNIANLVDRHRLLGQAANARVRDDFGQDIAYNNIKTRLFPDVHSDRSKAYCLNLFKTACEREQAKIIDGEGAPVLAVMEGVKNDLDNKISEILYPNNLAQDQIINHLNAMKSIYRVAIEANSFQYVNAILDTLTNQGFNIDLIKNSAGVFFGDTEDQPGIRTFLGKLDNNRGNAIWDQFKQNANAEFQLQINNCDSIISSHQEHNQQLNQQLNQQHQERNNTIKLALLETPTEETANVLVANHTGNYTNQIIESLSWIDDQLNILGITQETLNGNQEFSQAKTAIAAVDTNQADMQLALTAYNNAIGALVFAHNPALILNDRDEKAGDSIGETDLILNDVMVTKARSLKDERARHIDDPVANDEEDLGLDKFFEEIIVPKEGNGILEEAREEELEEALEEELEEALEEELEEEQEEALEEGLNIDAELPAANPIVPLVPEIPAVVSRPKSVPASARESKPLPIEPWIRPGKGLEKKQTAKNEQKIAGAGLGISGLLLIGFIACLFLAPATWIVVALGAATFGLGGSSAVLGAKGQSDMKKASDLICREQAHQGGTQTQTYHPNSHVNNLIKQRQGGRGGERARTI
ncbi:MAG: hypothetical protein IPP74_10055 [Alphaproteobacteria bacterium]|nr:hypothetical protein [Alphaproteobacteria bacterium]